MQLVASYPQIVGQVIRCLRCTMPLTQAEFSSFLGVSASGWSRVERGDTEINVAQLRQAARILRSTPRLIIDQADEVTRKIESSGVKVIDGRPRVDLNGKPAKFMIEAGELYLEDVGTLVRRAMWGNP